MTTEQIHDSRLAQDEEAGEKAALDWYATTSGVDWQDASYGFNAGFSRGCLHKEAQHQQKVRELVAYLGQCASWDSADLAQIINKHFGE